MLPFLVFLFYIFVSLKTLDVRPEYFIVPSNYLSERIMSEHVKWLETPGKKGQPHQDTNMRQFEDRNGEFLEKWELLK